MNEMVKYIAIILVLTITAYIFLKPIVTHENEYKVVIVNISNHDISKVKITGPGTNSYEMGTIREGHIQDYIFAPAQDGELEYLITQNDQSLRGAINSNLKKGDKGDIYVVVGERYNVKIYDEFDI